MTDDDNKFLRGLRRAKLLREKENVKPNPSILPLTVRQGLHANGYVDIHQSDITSYGKCPAKLRFKIKRSDVSYPANYLLGSVLHLALEKEYTDESVTNQGMNWKFWLALFEIVRARDKRVTFLYQGATLTYDKVVEWCKGFCRADYWGVPLANLVVSMLTEITVKGWSIIGAEQMMDFVDGDDTNGGYPVKFTGTLDLLLYHPGLNARAIVDMKSYGLWGPLGISAKDKAANKVLFDDMQVRFSRQMRHYHWMKSKVDRSVTITHYGFAAPTNLVPYQKNGTDYKVGDPKGPALFVATGVADNFIADYERALVGTLTMMSQGHFPKWFPEEYGKTLCHKCEFFRTCSGAPELSGLADIEGYDE